MLLEEGGKAALFEAAKELNANGTLGKIVPSHILSNIPLTSADEFSLFLENLPISSSFLRLRAHLFQPRASPGIFIYYTRFTEILNCILQDLDGMFFDLEEDSDDTDKVPCRPKSCVANLDN